MLSFTANGNVWQPLTSTPSEICAPVSKILVLFSSTVLDILLFHRAYSSLISLHHQVVGRGLNERPSHPRQGLSRLDPVRPLIQFLVPRLLAFRKFILMMRPKDIFESSRFKSSCWKTLFLNKILLFIKKWCEFILLGLKLYSEQCSSGKISGTKNLVSQNILEPKKWFKLSLAEQEDLGSILVALSNFSHLGYKMI